jgi:hypothetical protein
MSDADSGSDDDEDFSHMKLGEINFDKVESNAESDFVIFQVMAASSSSSLKETVFSNLYTFVACLCLENVTTNNARTSMAELWKLIHGNFSNVLLHYLKKVVAKTTYFPNETWPEGFIAYCDLKNSLMTNKVSKKWLNRHKVELKNVSEATIAVVYLGCNMQRCVQLAKKYINNMLNPLYNEDKIPSGHNTLGLLNAIR